MCMCVCGGVFYDKLCLLLILSLKSSQLDSALSPFCLALLGVRQQETYTLFMFIFLIVSLVQR